VEMKNMETILIADDHEIIRVGIHSIIERSPGKYNVIEASTCREVMDLMGSRKIEYAVLDLALADGNLFSASYDLDIYTSKIRMLVYSMNSEDIYARRLLQKGVRGFVSKQAKLEELEEAIRSVLKGGIYASNNLLESLFAAPKINTMPNPIDHLSDRELEIVELLITGYGTKQIANRLNLDMTTVSTYRRRANEKLKVKNLMELKDVFFWYKKSSGHLK
jgi:two-component system, NarL family, invasion response regulator UvrY